MTKMCGLVATPVCQSNTLLQNVVKTDKSYVRLTLQVFLKLCEKPLSQVSVLGY